MLTTERIQEQANHRRGSICARDPLRFEREGRRWAYDLIENDAELLPLDVEGKKYWLMYVTSMLACVDYEASEFQVYPDGRIGSYDALSFIPDAVEGHNLFKLSDRPFGFVYTSNAFKERAESIDAIGSRFVLVWDSSRSKPIELPLSLDCGHCGSRPLPAISDNCEPE